MLVWHAFSTLFYSPVPPSLFDIKQSVFLQILDNSLVLLGVRAYLHHRISFSVPVIFSFRIDSALNSVMFSLPM